MGAVVGSRMDAGDGGSSVSLTGRGGFRSAGLSGERGAEEAGAAEQDRGDHARRAPAGEGE